MSDDLTALEPWLAGIQARIDPRRRPLLARRVGQIMRKANFARASANVDPDGHAMNPRNPKRERPPKDGKRRPRRDSKRHRTNKGRMFKRLELARNMVVRPGADQVEVAFNARVAATAAVHHYGLEDAVDRRIRNSIRVRYKARRLLGFGPGDRDLMLAEIMNWLEGQ